MIKSFVKKMRAIIANYIGVYFVPKLKSELIFTDMAEKVLQKHSIEPKTSALWERLHVEETVDLTIVVPVYNAEKYLVKCIDSIINQKTTYTYEVVIVDDCSRDNTNAILNQYEDNAKIKILRQLTNQGVSKARNMGLCQAHGKYVMFVDSDDYLHENAVQVFLETAYGLGADIVQGGYYYIDCLTERIVHKKTYYFGENIPPNGVIEGMVCGKIYLTSLFDYVCFPEGYWYEDTIITALISHLAKSIVTIPNMVYFYRQNPNGQTYNSRGKPKSIDTLWVHRCVLCARKALGLSAGVDFYEHLLRMVVLSYKRTEQEEEIIKMSLFVQFGEMIRSVRQDSYVVKTVYRNLEKSILSKDYAKYSFLCKYL